MGIPSIIRAIAGLRGNNASDTQSNDTTNTAVNFNGHRVASARISATYLATSNEHTQASGSRLVQPSTAVVPEAPNNNNDSSNSSPIKNLQEQITNELANLKEVKVKKIFTLAIYSLLCILVAKVILIFLSVNVSFLFLIPSSMLPILIILTVFFQICCNIMDSDMMMGKGIGLQLLANIFKNYKQPDNNINLSYDKLQTCLSNYLNQTEKEAMIFSLHLQYALYRNRNEFSLSPEENTYTENIIIGELKLFYEELFTELADTFKEANFDMDKLKEAKDQYLESLTIEDVSQLLKKQPPLTHLKQVLFLWVLLD